MCENSLDLWRASSQDYTTSKRQHIDTNEIASPNLQTNEQFSHFSGNKIEQDPNKPNSDFAPQ